jgi:hypothetical protein
MLYSLRLFVFPVLLLTSCTKSSDTKESDNGMQLAYEKSIYFLSDSDYAIRPVEPRAGIYSAFPDNLNIDENTGEVIVSLLDKDGKDAQVGLKYQVYFRSANGLIKDTTEITLACINYQDVLLEENKGDSVMLPNFQNSGPDKNRFFGFEASDRRLSIDETSGAINLLESTRSGFFGDRPENQDWKQVKVFYKDRNNPKLKYEIELITYFYSSVGDIPSNVSEAMRAHQNLLLGIPSLNIPISAAPIDKSINNIISPRKPRPPCIIIVGK